MDRGEGHRLPTTVGAETCAEVVVHATIGALDERALRSVSPFVRIRETEQRDHRQRDHDNPYDVRDRDRRRDQDDTAGSAIESVAIAEHTVRVDVDVAVTPLFS